MWEAIITGVVGIVVCMINNHYQLAKIKAEQKKTTEEQMQALKLGVQALLRDRLLWEYDKWQEKGYCPYDKKQNVENLHKQYAALGQNGVMDAAHKEFMELPLSK